MTDTHTGVVYDISGGGLMRVQRVTTPVLLTESWTVVDVGGVLVEPVDRFLAHLSAVERSPNTVRAYAHDLRDFFSFLEQTNRRWTEVTIEDLGRFSEWLRLPAGADAGRVTVLSSQVSARSVATINRKLSAVTSFYVFHERRGVTVAEHLTAWRTGQGGSWQPLLAHLGPKAHRARASGLVLRADSQAPEVLTAEQIDRVLAACTRQRDRLIYSVLRDTGMRSGEALGLRHDDIDVASSTVRVRRRVNANMARAKSAVERVIPAPARLFRLYSDYLNDEYGALDSDYVFVNLGGPGRGQPWKYDSFHDLTERVRVRSAVVFRPHMFRHTYATELLERGVTAEIVQLLMGHASYATTVDTYAHPRTQEARRALERVGWLSPPADDRVTA